MLIIDKQLSEPVWLHNARLDLGQCETRGPNDSPWIRRMLKKLNATWLLGQPWCGGAVAKWMGDYNIPIPTEWYRAKAWATWGTELKGPRTGCIVVFSRQGGGHVGLIVGSTENGNYLVLGGNQGDTVSIREFSHERVLAFRWPPNCEVPPYQLLTVGVAPVSLTEA